MLHEAEVLYSQGFKMTDVCRKLGISDQTHRRWRHTDFHLHSKVRAETKRKAERVGKYMILPLLSLERLFFDVMKIIRKGGKKNWDP